MRNTKITAEELHKAVKFAEMAVKITDKIGNLFDDEVKDYEPAEDIWEKEEKKVTAKKNGVKETVLEADDLEGMLEWLKGELENLEGEADD